MRSPSLAPDVSGKGQDESSEEEERRVGMGGEWGAMEGWPFSVLTFSSTSLLPI